MKWVLAYAFAGALLGSAAAGLFGCGASRPQVQDARVVLAQAVAYAEDAAAVTRTICTLQPGGKPCVYMVTALDKAFEMGAKIEDALNRGEDVEDQIEELEAELGRLLNQAQSMLKGMV